MRGINGPGGGLPGDDAVFHASFFVLKICSEFPALVMLRDGPAIMENRDIKPLVGITGDRKRESSA